MMGMYKVDDGMDHWVIAKSPQDAKDLVKEQMGDDYGDHEMDVEMLTKAQAADTKYWDEDGTQIGTMWSEFMSDMSRRYLGGSEF